MYEWAFDTTKFKDKWHELSGRQAALKTPSSWDNPSLGLYVVDKKLSVDGGLEITCATLKVRIEKILHVMEILIDTQRKIGSQDGIRIPQTVDFRQDIIGFDFRGIIELGSTIYARIKYIESRGPLKDRHRSVPNGKLCPSTKITWLLLFPRCNCYTNGACLGWSQVWSWAR